MNTKAKILTYLLIILSVSLFTIMDVKVYLDTQKGMDGRAIAKAKVISSESTTRKKKGIKHELLAMTYEYKVGEKTYTSVLEATKEKSEKYQSNEFNVIYETSDPEVVIPSDNKPQIHTIKDLLMGIGISFLKFGIIGFIVGYGISSKLGWVKTEEELPAGSTENS